MNSVCDGGATVIPGLPNDVAAWILSKVPYSHHARLKSTCKSWKLLLSSRSFLNSLNKRNHLLCIFPQDPSIASPFLFDPNALAWCPLPPMPCNPHVYGLCNFAAVPLGPHLYVLGGSLFDTRSFPIDRPSPSSATFRFNFHDFSWEPRAPMLTPRGSFACAVVQGRILVAGGGSRHTMFGAAGTRIRSVERYEVGRDRWVAMDPLPGFRAGCVGFVGGEGREFWVVGGYGASRTISGVFPVDEYYRDAVVILRRKSLNSNEKQRKMKEKKTCTANPNGQRPRVVVTTSSHRHSVIVAPPPQPRRISPQPRRISPQPCRVSLLHHCILTTACEKERREGKKLRFYRARLRTRKKSKMSH